MPTQSYPYLTQDQFNGIIEEFRDIYENSKNGDLNDWQSVAVCTYVNAIRA